LVVVLPCDPCGGEGGVAGALPPAGADDDVAAVVVAGVSGDPLMHPPVTERVSEPGVAGGALEVDVAGGGGGVPAAAVVEAGGNVLADVLGSVADVGGDIRDLAE